MSQRSVRRWRYRVPWWWVLGAGMVVLAWTVTTVMMVADALRTTNAETVPDYWAPLNVFSIAFLIIAFYMLFCWMRAVLEAKRASVTTGPTGVEITDWRGSHLSVPWDEIEKVASLDYGGFCKPARVVLYTRDNLVYEFSPWLISPDTLLDQLRDGAGLQKSERSWSRQFWA